MELILIVLRSHQGDARPDDSLSYHISSRYRNDAPQAWNFGVLPLHSTVRCMRSSLSFSVFDVTVPTMLHGLSVLDDYLDHAQTLERSRGLVPGEVLQARLAFDMLPFGKQLSILCNKVEAHMSKLMQRDLPAPVEPAIMYPALKGRLLETRGFLQAIEPYMLSSAHTYTYAIMPTITHGWHGGDYIRHLIIPDFFFHISIAHAILRHLGAPVGKREYLGNLSQLHGGDS